MSLQTIQEFKTKFNYLKPKGNVFNMQTENKTWYIDLIRNPNLSPDAKIIYLNLRINANSYNENIKSLMVKCNLSERSVSKGLKELELNEYITREQKHIDGRYIWTYQTNIKIQSPQKQSVVLQPVEYNA